MKEPPEEPDGDGNLQEGQRMVQQRGAGRRRAVRLLRLRVRNRDHRGNQVKQLPRRSNEGVDGN